MKSESHNLLKGSAVLLVCFGLYHLLNFAFHFFMARSLSVENYGILAFLISFVYILSIFSESLQLVITKYVSPEKDGGKIKNLLKRSIKKFFKISMLMCAIFLIIALPLSSVLDVDYYLLAISSSFIFIVLFLPLTRGIMQGRKKYFSLGSNMVIESLGKLLFAIGFVYLGWQVGGALLGIVFGSTIAFIMSFFAIRDIRRAKEKTVLTGEIYQYSRPAFIITLAVTLFYSVDIIYAKMFFSVAQTGIYAIASVLAKAIFWGTQPISKALFPITAENVEGKKQNNLLLNAFLMLGALVLIALAVFFFAPEFIISLFSGKNIPEATKILFYLGAGTSVLTFTNLILIYRLSKSEINHAPNKIIVFAVSLFMLMFLFGLSYHYWAATPLLTMVILSIIAEMILLVYCLVHNYDIGWLLFVMIEGVLFFIFRESLVTFSIAFLTSSAAFFLAAVLLHRDD